MVTLRVFGSTRVLPWNRARSGNPKPGTLSKLVPGVSGLADQTHQNVPLGRVLMVGLGGGELGSRTFFWTPALTVNFSHDNVVCPVSARCTSRSFGASSSVPSGALALASLT